MLLCRKGNSNHVSRCGPHTGSGDVGGVGVRRGEEGERGKNCRWGPGAAACQPLPQPKQGRLCYPHPENPRAHVSDERCLPGRTSAGRHTILRCRLHLGLLREVSHPGVVALAPRDVEEHVLDGIGSLAREVCRVTASWAAGARRAEVTAAGCKAGTRDRPACFGFMAGIGSAGLGQPRRTPCMPAPVLGRSQQPSPSPSCTFPTGMSDQPEET